MLDQVLDIFEIVPEYDLNIMKAGQDLYDITANVLIGMKSILVDFNPDIVLVHGDTTTTLPQVWQHFMLSRRLGMLKLG